MEYILVTKNKCFGNFEAFYKGEPLKFAYSKSKEVFAYLVDREGAAFSIFNIFMFLFFEVGKR